MSLTHWPCDLRGCESGLQKCEDGLQECSQDRWCCLCFTCTVRAFFVRTKWPCRVKTTPTDANALSIWLLQNLMSRSRLPLIPNPVSSVQSNKSSSYCTTSEENSYTEEHLSRPPELPITDNMKKHDSQPCKLPQADEKAEVCTYACNIL